MANRTFSKRIRNLRIDHNLSMDALAKKLGVTKSRISMWENNGTVPRDDILICLARLYGVSTDYLLGNDALEECRPKEPDRLAHMKRNLEKLNNQQLLKAESLLRIVFPDIFEEEDI